MIIQHYFSQNDSEEIRLVDFDVSILDNIYKLKTASGIFSYQGIDKGTNVLLEFICSERGLKILNNTINNAVDIGCGWGIISLFLALKFPHIKNITAVDINQHAVTTTRTNAKLLKINNINAVNSSEVDFTYTRYDLLISNPPIRIGKTNTIKLLDDYLKIMNDDGFALFVIQKNLGADSICKSLQAIGYNSQKIASSKGFRIIKVTK